MKIKKKIIIVSIFLIPILAMGATLVYSANLIDEKSSLIREAMNPFDFFKQCREIGGLVFSWDNGYGCDFVDDYDVICDNNGVCGEGFVIEIDPQKSEADSQNDEVTGTIFDVGLHDDDSGEESPPVIPVGPQTNNADEEDEQPPDDPPPGDLIPGRPSPNPSPEEIEAACKSVGGTYFEEGNSQGCKDIPGKDDWVCSNLKPCHLDGNKLADNFEDTIPISFGNLIPVDPGNIYLFIYKPDTTPFSFLIKSDDSQINPLAGSNQLYNNLAGQAAKGEPINIGIFLLKSKWGMHEYEGLTFAISRLSYLLPESPEEAPETEIVEQIEEDVEPEPTEQVLLTVSPKQDMNCRCGAGTYTDYLTTFRIDTVATVLGQNGDKDWYFVELEGGTRCWVWGDGLQDVSHLEDVSIPDATSTELGQVCTKEKARDDSGTIDPRDQKEPDGEPDGDGGIPPGCGINCDDYIDPGQYDPLDPPLPPPPVVD